MLITRDGNKVTLINVFDTKPEQQQALVDQWIEFTEEIKDEAGFIGAALHKSTDGTRVINYAHWQTDTNFEDFLKRHGEDFNRFNQNATQIDPHTYEVVYLYERANS
ncbi:antibiotic biosynthesis monooxygenase [Ktedonosporobacter rubrisoli]|uniref:Antibiotic biosynthesis monooxygenase n=1 Tax=Ktedonosporobacter rubrisoli TaxID=2509675 RepID=A0A4P6JN26_KTERU|nr:antibiotic biosynthesis monooxygenase family protein [Ktedonosporobacter rubrisoli]QBD76664.1 antibiotic biosynthesis monooxygenase [Ktedonosporobacter rubrisoli]